MLNKLLIEVKYNRKKRYMLICLVLFIVAFLYYTLSIRSYSWYVGRKKLINDPGHPCVTPEKDMKALRELGSDIHAVLTDLKLTHVLIYGSLWGALRYEDPVPWDNDIDMLLLDVEVNKLDFGVIKDKFEARGMKIWYRLWLGTYRVTRGDFARADLMIFRHTYIGNSMCRTGLEPWILFVNHFRFHTFPAYLIEQPLATRRFAGVNISIPNNGIEIQKHFYPYDWWKEVKPRGC